MANARFTGASVGIKLPFLSIQGTWKVEEHQRDAAWELYVELVTRISTIELKEGEGSIREALTSFYSLFATTRDVLKKYGPVIASSGDKDDITLGYIAVAMLNKVVRPLLSKWHPKLKDFEHSRAEKTSEIEHEQSWEHAKELRAEINKVRIQLLEYTDVLGEYAGVNSLVERTDGSNASNG